MPLLDLQKKTVRLYSLAHTCEQRISITFFNENLEVRLVVSFRNLYATYFTLRPEFFSLHCAVYMNGPGTSHMVSFRESQSEMGRH